MTRISRTARMKAERIQSSYVNRKNEAGGINKIEHIQRIEKLKNPTNHPSENQLLSYERYYQTIKEAKKEFNRYYMYEKDLYELIVSLNEDGKKLILQLDEFVHKYNNVLAALQNFDILAGTEHSLSIQNLFLEFTDAFYSLGIKKEIDSSLSFNPNHLKHSLKTSNRFVSELICSFKKTVIEQYLTITHINNHLHQQTRYDIHALELKGLIIEEKG